MPTYVYRREDGTTFDYVQRITADPLAQCPTTGQRVYRVISGGTGFILKGSGFYKTDYATNGNGVAKGDAEASDGAESKASAQPKADAQSASKDTKEAAPAATDD